MKYTLIVIVMILGLLSCNNKEQSSTDPQYELKTVLIDGCEYIEHPGYESYAITHKGNCKNH